METKPQRAELSSISGSQTVAREAAGPRIALERTVMNEPIIRHEMRDGIASRLTA
jgi:hypothetical protein